MKGVALVWFAIFCVSQAQALTPSVVRQNNRAVEGLLSQDSEESVGLLLQGLEKEPFSFELRMNLGLAYLAREDFQRAEGEFLAAVELFEENPDQQFQALFNLALTRTFLNNLDGALKAYQQALILYPDSLEVKKNIELLWQMEGSGQGEGESDPDQEGDGDGDGDGDGQDDNDSDRDYQQSPQPQEFQSQQLSPDDVRRILEELRAQEQAIRAKELSQQAKDAAGGNDW